MLHWSSRRKKERVLTGGLYHYFTNFSSEYRRRKGIGKVSDNLIQDSINKVFLKYPPVETQERTNLLRNNTDTK